MSVTSRTGTALDAIPPAAGSTGQGGAPAPEVSGADGALHAPAVLDPIPATPERQRAREAAAAPGTAAPEPGTPVSEPSSGVFAAFATQWTRLRRPFAIAVITRALTVVQIWIWSIVGGVSLPWALSKWDGQWFLLAATGGYPQTLPMQDGHVWRNTTAFTPVLPLAIRWLSWLTRLSALSAGIVITSITGVLALVAIWILVERFAGRAAADRAALLVGVFPGALMLSMVYAEGLEIVLVVLCLVALERCWWLAAGVAAGLATATAPITLVLIVPCCWAAVGAVRHSRAWRALVAPLLVPIGFAAFLGYLWWHTGSPWSLRTTEEGGWQSTITPLYPFRLIVGFLRDPIGGTANVNFMLVGLALAALCAWVAIRAKLPATVLAYGLSAAALAASTSHVGLRPRFLLCAFPLLAAVGIRLRGWRYAVAVGVLVALSVAFGWYTIDTWAVFP